MMPISRLPLKLRPWLSSLPIRYALMIPLVLEILLAVGIIGILASWTSRRAVNDVVFQLRSEVSDRVQDKLTEYLNLPHLINHINAEAVRQGLLDVQNPRADQYLWHQIQHVQSVSWIYFGDEAAGQFIGVHRDLTGQLSLTVNDQADQNQGRSYSLGSQGQRSDLRELGPEGFDARQRPWYQAAVKAQQATWSDLYLSFAQPQMVLSAVLPVYSDSGTLLGVSGVDLSPADISRFLKQLSVEGAEHIFIIDRSGQAIADSIHWSSTESSDSPDTITSQLLDTITQRLIKDHGTLAAIQAQSQLNSQVRGEQFFSEILPYQTEHGIDWLIIVSVPESAFIDDIKATTRVTRWLALVALGITIWLGLRTARWITDPIERLNQAAQRIAQGHFDQTVTMKRRDELGSLADAFNQMAQQLQASFQLLEHRNQELEAEVQDRTAHLLDSNNQLQIEVAERRTAEAALREQVNLAALGSNIGVTLTQNDQLDHLLEQCAAILKHHLNAVVVCLWTLNPTEGVLVLQSSVGPLIPPDLIPQRIGITPHGLGQIAYYRRVIQTSLGVETSEFPELQDLQVNGIQAIAGYPLMVEQEVVGILMIASQQTINEITQHSIAAVANEIALGIKHKRIEDTLRERESLYRSIVENTSDLVAIHSLEGKFLYLSPNYATTLGFRIEDLIGEPWSSLIHPDDQATLSASIEELVRCHNDIKSSAYRLVDREGAWRWYISTVSCARGSGKQPLYYVSISRDVTERILYEDQLKQAKEAAEVANRAKSEFLASMSHELRTPLNGILGYAQILQREPNLDPTQEKGLSVIQRSGQHLLTLINDILDLSKIEANKLDIHNHEFDLCELLNTIEDLFHLRAQQKDITFLTEAFSPLPRFVMGDEQKLRQVLINLLGNAVKFTQEGSVLFKVGYPDEQAAISNTMRFQVEDTGIGIPAHKVDEIFLPFKQVSHQQHLTEGTGLGLAISKRLVELMGSTLNVKSRLGTGSVFWIDLILPRSQAQTEEQLRLDPLKDGRRIIGIHNGSPQILVVDDHPTNRSLIVNLLSPLGFQVSEASSGYECLEWLHDHQPDLILMDLVMPELDGLATTRLVRQMPSMQAVIIIASSASAFDHDQQASFAAGCTDFLTKPIQPQQLLDKLHYYLDLEWLLDTLPAEPVETLSYPPELITRLLDLAKIGDIKGILKQMEQLEHEQPYYTDLVSTLRQLAKGFKVKKIRDYLSSLLTDPNSI